MKYKFASDIRCDPYLEHSMSTCSRTLGPRNMACQTTSLSCPLCTQHKNVVTARCFPMKFGSIRVGSGEGEPICDGGLPSCVEFSLAFIHGFIRFSADISSMPCSTLKAERRFFRSVICEHISPFLTACA